MRKRLDKVGKGAVTVQLTKGLGRDRYPRDLCPIKSRQGNGVGIGDEIAEQVFNVDSAGVDVGTVDALLDEMRYDVKIGSEGASVVVEHSHAFGRWFVVVWSRKRHQSSVSVFVRLCGAER